MMQSITGEKPRLASEVQQQLKELLEIKRAVENGGDFGFAGETNLRSIQVHEAELRDELRLAKLVESNASAEFVFDGEPLRGHDVPAQLFGPFLDRLQSFVYAVGQAQTGSPTARARVPQHVVQANKLFVKPEFVAGSFGFRVRVPEKEEANQLFETEADPALQTVCSVLGEDNPEEQMMKLLSHSRVKSHYAAILDLLVRQNASVSMRHRDVAVTMHLSSSQARQRVEWLQQLQTTEETIDLPGYLVGGSIERDQFELKTDNGTIRGSLSEQAKEEMKHFHWGAAVVAGLRVLKKEHEEMSAEPTETYVASRFSSP